MSSIVKKVMMVGRATTFMVGLTMILALMFGVTTTALAGTGVGARFDLGKVNTVNAITKLVGSVAGPSLQIDNSSANTNATALDLQVEAGKAPMTVNSEAKVANLNADKLDGLSADEIGVSGYQGVSETSASNSIGNKTLTVVCPQGKVLVGSGYDTSGAYGGVVISSMHIFPTGVSLEASDQTPTSSPWSVTVYAACVAT